MGVFTDFGVYTSFYANTPLSVSRCIPLSTYRFKRSSFGGRFGGGRRFFWGGWCQMLGAIPLAIHRFYLASNIGIVQIEA